MSLTRMISHDDMMTHSAGARQARQDGHIRHARHHWQSQNQPLAAAMVHVVVHGPNIPVNAPSPLNLRPPMVRR